MKKILAGFTIGVLIAAMPMVSYAGKWKTDDNGWWYDYGDGTYPVNQWQWIDGNGDGISECYYFNNNGYCLVDTITPDGYYVNEEGAWLSGGKVQTQSNNIEAASAYNTLDLTVGKKATWSYSGSFTGTGNLEEFAIYQYSIFEDRDSCQIWYKENGQARQLFQWENTTGNSFCNLGQPIRYQSEDGKTYFVVNSWCRVAASHSKYMIFGADRKGKFKMVCEGDGSIEESKSGSLLVTVETIDMNSNGSLEYDYESYSARIQNGRLVKEN